MSVAFAAWWIAVDRTPPMWDQSVYLWDSLQYVNASHSDGAGGVVHAFFTVDRFHGPGYPALVFPFMLVMGPTAQSALVANVLMWIVLLLTVAALARSLFGSEAGLIAMAITATIPILQVMLHEALVDLAAATWACLAVLAMLRTAHFTWWPPAALAGALAGVGVLTKANVLVFLAGPALVIGMRAVLRLRTASRGPRLRVAGNMLLAVAVALAVAGPWYVTNWDSTLSYLTSATEGSLALGAGPANPLDPAAIATFGLTIVNDMSFWVAAGLASAGLILLWDRTKPVPAGTTARARTGKHFWSWALMTSLVLIPLGVLMASRNQAPRYALVAFPGLAIILAGLCGMLRPRWLRGWVVGVVLAAGLAQVGLAQLDPGSVQGGAAVRLAVGSAGDLRLLAPAYPAADPAGDDATPVMRALEAIANGRPARVLVAEEDRAFNVDTLRWLASVRHDRFTFVNPNAAAGDPAELNSFDFAIYLPASVVAQRDPGNRLHLLNETAATTVFGDRLFSIFGRSRHQVAIEGGKAWVLER